MIGGVTLCMLSHLSGVPHLHVNRSLEQKMNFKYSHAPKSTSLTLSCPFSLSCYLSCSNVDSILGEDHNTHFLEEKATEFMQRQ